MALITCPECGKEISESAEACIHCGYAIRQVALDNEKKAKVKENKKRLIGFIKKVTPVVAVLVVIIITWQVFFPNLFATTESLMADGNYAEAINKASKDDKTAIIAENHIAFVCYDVMNNLKNKNSFELSDAYYVMGKSLTLEVIANNSYGNPVVNIWQYLYSEEANSYTLQGVVSDLETREPYSWETKEEQIEVLQDNLTKYSIKRAQYSWLPLSDDAVKRVNSLAKSGKLGKTILIPYVTDDN